MNKILVVATGWHFSSHFYENMIQQKVLENKRLDWAIARIKECGKLKQAGILIAKNSEFYNLCADIYIDKKPNQVIPHPHD